MTEPSLPTPPERASVEGPTKRRLDGLPLLYALGAVVLLGSLAWLYSNPTQPAVREADILRPQIEALTARVAQLEGRAIPSVAPVEGRVAALEGRLAAVETRPAPTPPDLSPLVARVDAAATKAEVGTLATRLDTTATKTEVGALATRLDAAAAKQDVTALSARVDAAAAKTDLTALAGRVETVEGRAAGAEQAARAAVTQAVGQASAQLTSQVNTQLAAVTEATRRAARVQAAAAALDAGQPLGDMPGAPPPLARFAAAAPPTEAALRLSFDAAADAASRASQAPITETQSFAERMLTRAQQTVTVRQGDQVVVGNPVAGVLTRAKQSVDAGDLSGALGALDSLTGPAAAAMKPWADQARSLLEARAALAQMARG